jgi:diaminohydroxyphosphoribosylaminopyrimidine deaminase/5-amino-6-(5-phosphoribosylamino)uracil reductase
MAVAIDVSRECVPVPGAYSVGAVLVGEDGREIARGWSRESDPHVHAEESALSKVPADDPRLASATLYSTLEPCSERRSRPRTCTQLILSTAIPRIVIAWREPSLFVDDCQGFENLVAEGRTVIELHEMAGQARAANAHLWPGEV